MVAFSSSGFGRQGYREEGRLPRRLYQLPAFTNTTEACAAGKNLKLQIIPMP
jgi:hypothetical protein